MDSYESLHSHIRILSIDPGTNHLGFAIIDLIPDRGMVVVDVATLEAMRLASQYKSLIEVHGEKIAKLYALEMALNRIMSRFKPHYVVSESPYLGRFPNAFAALVECFNMIRRALIDFNPCMPLNQLDPSTIKKSVGVSGKSGDKSLMTLALAKLSAVEIDLSEFSLDNLDEHSVDAIAAGYAYVKNEGLLSIGAVNLGGFNRECTQHS